MGTYIALAVSFTIIGGFAYLGMKATDEIITYFNQELPEKEKKDGKHKWYNRERCR